MSCNHTNRYYNHISFNLGFWVCPDCKQEVTESGQLLDQVPEIPKNIQKLRDKQTKSLRCKYVSSKNVVKSTLNIWNENEYYHYYDSYYNTISPLNKGVVLIFKGDIITFQCGREYVSIADCGYIYEIYKAYDGNIYLLDVNNTKQYIVLTLE